MSTILKPGLFIHQVENPIVNSLNWKQPFLKLMEPPYNKIETRIWNTKVRGWVLMCASKVSYSAGEVYNIAGARQFIRIKEALSKYIDATGANMVLPLGCATHIGRLVEVRPMTKKDDDRCFVEWYSTKKTLYCHIYEDVYPIQEIPWHGSQGWGKVSDAVISQIKIL